MEVSLIELGELEPDIVGFLGILCCLFLALADKMAQGCQLLVSCLVFAQLLAVASHGVEYFLLEGVFAKEQVLVLGMDVDEEITESLEYGELNGHVVDEGTRLACGVYLTADDGGLWIKLQVVVGKESLKTVGTDVEGGFDHALGRACPYGLGIGSLSEDEREGSHDDALSCTSLTGDDRQSFHRVELQSFYERVIFYTQ